ncbi:MAG: hypothetical protein HY694_05325 [Deltaproteobacteria bacterium]|nr:hypothetical protein [Deltaproteobacteria bacterium]
MEQRPTWRNLQRREGPPFLDWLAATNQVDLHLRRLADELVAFLTDQIQAPDDAEAFWNAIPAVREECNRPEIYDLFMHSEAYAYVHLLDRYWRTWEALQELLRHNLLPMGDEGVRLLDVGTGPAPTPYGIQDFYEVIRRYGDEHDLPGLRSQRVDTMVIERSASMARLMHHFSEFTGRPGPFGSDRTDFVDFSPKREREALYSQRLSELYEMEESEPGFYFFTDDPNDEVQRHLRFRFVVLSNFLTIGDAVRTFEKPLYELFSDLQPGAVAMVLSARGNQYETIHEDLRVLVEKCRMYEVQGPATVLGGNTYAEVAAIVKQAQYRVYTHVESLATVDLPRTRRFPDYWSPEPYPGKRPEFALRVYRKGRWRRIAGSQVAPVSYEAE